MPDYGVHARTARIAVPLNLITLTGSGATYTRDAQGQFSISLPTASTLYRLGVPLVLPPYRVTGASAPNLVGFRLRSIVLWYSITSVDLSSHTFTINQEGIAGNAARAAAVEVGGTLTYNTDDGASSALGTAARANLYKTVVTLGAPIALTTDMALITAEWSMTTGATSGSAKVHGLLLRGDLGWWS